MVNNVVDDRAQLPAIKARESGRDAYQGGHMAAAPVARMAQTEMVEHLKIGWADNVVCLVYQDKLEARRVELVQPVGGGDALNRGNGDVRSARGGVVAHFDLDVFFWIGEGAVTCGLLDQLTAVGEDEGLRCMANWGYAVDEVGEDDRLAGAGGEGHTE